MITLEFAKRIDFIDDGSMYIFPFRADVDRILERRTDDFSLIGWNVISLRDLIAKIHLELFPELDELKPATRFAIVHRILLESDFLEEFKQQKRKTGIAESLVELFVVLDEAGILSEEDIDNILPRCDERTAGAMELYKIFRKELFSRKLVTSGDVFAKISSQILDGNIPKIFRNKKQMNFINFLEFNIPQQGFVKSLAERFDVSIGFKYPISVFPKNWREPVEKIAKNFGIEIKFPEVADGHWLSDALDGHPENAHASLSSADDKIPDFALLEMPDVRREVESVAKIAKILSIEQEIPPDEIFIITPNPQRYAPLLANAFDRANIQYSFDRQIESDVDIYDFLKRIVAAIRSDWRRQELFDLLKHPILRWQFDSIEQLERISIRRRIVNKHNWLNTDFEGFVPIIKLIKSFDFLAEQFDASKIPELLNKIFDAAKIRQFPNGNMDKKMIIEKQLEKILKDARKLATGYGNFEKLTGIELILSLIHISRNNLPEHSEKNLGVRMFNVLEGKGNGGSLAFYVGFGKNNFPSRQKKNAILMQNYDEFAPFVSDKMHIDNLSLILGLMSADKFYLMYPLADGEMDVGRSQPIDEIFRFCKGGIAGEKIPNAADIFKMFGKYELTHFDRTFNIALEATIEKSIRSRNLNFTEIGNKILGERIGVHELETFWRCPMRYFFEQTIGETEPQPEEETLPYTELGIAIHKALELFYRRRYENILGETLPKLQLNNILNIKEILHLYYEKIKAKYNYLIDNIVINSNNIMYAVRDFVKCLNIQIDMNRWYNKEIPFSRADELEFGKGFTEESFARRILEIEIELRQNIGSKNLPFIFELPLVVPLRVDNKTVRISGRIDRIDMLEDGSLILIDYKTGAAKGVSSEGDVKVGKLKLDKEIQLQIYALLLHNLGFDISGLAYISRIRDWNGPYADFSMEIDMDNIDEKIKSLLFDLSAGNFDFTSDTKNCDYCPYAEQCTLIR